MMRIKELRIKAELSQALLAEKMNVTQSTVSLWESGYAFPASDKLPKLAEVLGCGIADLFAVPEKKEGE